MVLEVLDVEEYQRMPALPAALLAPLSEAVRLLHTLLHLPDCASALVRAPAASAGLLLLLTVTRRAQGADAGACSALPRLCVACVMSALRRGEVGAAADSEAAEAATGAVPMPEPKGADAGEEEAVVEAEVGDTKRSRKRQPHGAAASTWLGSACDVLACLRAAAVIPANR